MPPFLSSYVPDVDIAGFPTPFGRFPNPAATAPAAALDPGHFSQWSSHLRSTALREQREASQGHPSSFSLCRSNKEEWERHGLLLSARWRLGWVMIMGLQKNLCFLYLALCLCLLLLCIFSRDSCFSHHLLPAAGPCLFRFRGPFNLVRGMELYSQVRTCSVGLKCRKTRSFLSITGGILFIFVHLVQGVGHDT